MQKRILILDDGIGNKDAPQGSRQWAIYFGHRARMRADSARSTVAALQELLHTLKENSAHQAMGYSSWGEFLQRDVLITEEQATAVLSAPASTTVGAALADKARQLKTFRRPSITSNQPHHLPQPRLHPVRHQGETVAVGCDQKSDSGST